MIKLTKSPLDNTLYEKGLKDIRNDLKPWASRSDSQFKYHYKHIFPAVNVMVLVVFTCHYF